MCLLVLPKTSKFIKPTRKQRFPLTHFLLSLRRLATACGALLLSSVIVKIYQALLGERVFHLFWLKNKILLFAALHLIGKKIRQADIAPMTIDPSHCSSIPTYRSFGYHHQPWLGRWKTEYSFPFPMPGFWGLFGLYTCVKRCLFHYLRTFGKAADYGQEDFLIWGH